MPGERTTRLVGDQMTARVAHRPRRHRNGGPEPPRTPPGGSPPDKQEVDR